MPYPVFARPVTSLRKERKPPKLVGFTWRLSCSTLTLVRDHCRIELVRESSMGTASVPQKSWQQVRSNFSSTHCAWRQCILCLCNDITSQYNVRCNTIEWINVSSFVLITFRNDMLGTIRPLTFHRCDDVRIIIHNA